MKQTAKPEASPKPKAAGPASLRPKPQQTVMPAGPLAQLAAMMSGSSRVQNLAQPQSAIQQSPRVQGLTALAAGINHGVTSKLPGLAANGEDRQGMSLQGPMGMAGINATQPVQRKQSMGVVQRQEDDQDVQKNGGEAELQETIVALKELVKAGGETAEELQSYIDELEEIAG